MLLQTTGLSISAIHIRLCNKYVHAFWLVVFFDRTGSSCTCSIHRTPRIPHSTMPRPTRPITVLVKTSFLTFLLQATEQFSNYYLYLYYFAKFLFLDHFHPFPYKHFSRALYILGKQQTGEQHKFCDFSWALRARSPCPRFGNWHHHQLGVETPWVLDL